MKIGGERKSKGLFRHAKNKNKEIRFYFFKFFLLKDKENKIFVSRIDSVRLKRLIQGRFVKFKKFSPKKYFLFSLRL